MQKKRIEVELIDVPVAVRPHSVEAPVSCSCARNWIPVECLEKCWRLSEIAVDPDLLPSEPGCFERLVEVRVHVVRLIRGQAGRYVGVTDYRDRIAGVVILGVPLQFDP